MKRSLLVPMLTCAIAGSAFPPQGRAQHAPPADLVASVWKPVSDASLDALRGGFQLPSGLVLSFGIERMAYVNGQLVTTQRYNMVDGGQPETLVVQVGQGSRIETTPAGGLVIQNTLDHQNIQVDTRIDATVGTLGLFQALNVQDLLQGALQGAVGP